MRVAIFLSFILGISVALCVVVLVYALVRLDGYHHEIDLLGLAEGRVHELLALPWLWRGGLTDFPALWNFVDLKPGLSALGVLALCASILRRRGKFTWVTLGLCTLGGTFLLYAVGYAWLAQGHVPFRQCGPWLAWMLLNVFYGGMSSILCGALQLRSMTQSVAVAPA